MRDTLKYLRHRRTRRSNEVRGQIAYMLDAPAPHVGEDGLPSWWPFWSDVLKSTTRDVVRAAREVEAAEQGGFP